MKQWCVYLLECSDNTYYCGSTNDLTARIDTHNSGKGSKYTRARLPVKLLKSFLCADKSEALKLEHKIKQLSRQQKFDLIYTTDTNIESE